MTPSLLTPTLSPRESEAAWLDSLPPGLKLRLLRAMEGRPNHLDMAWLDPSSLMTETPDKWQVEALAQVITRREDALFCCSRGAGKSRAMQVAAYAEAAIGGYALIISNAMDLTTEFFSGVKDLHDAHRLVPEATKPTKTELRLTNGGRVLCRPATERVRGWHGVTLLVVDEAAQIKDDVWTAVSATRVISKGRVVMLSTPKGQRGFFWREWVGRGRQNWRRHRVTWRECPRIDADQIEQERLSLGDLGVQQEYECKFLSIVGGVFNVAAFEALVDEDQEVDW